MLQDRFLNAVTRGRVPVTVYLVNGVRFQAQIESHDQYDLMLTGISQQFVYKRVIATMVPSRDVTSAVQSGVSDLTSDKNTTDLPAGRARRPRPAE